MFFIYDPSGGIFSVLIEPKLTAKINADGTIAAIPDEDGNVFEEYNGFTVEQMKDEAERAKAWHRDYVK